MLVTKETGLEIEGEVEGAIEASIAKEDLPFIMDVLTRQQYRDPIGSIVREITSNCFDAHIEANVDFPVIVEFSNDELGHYVSFTDQGIGMSPERIKTVYLSYGRSTKRETKLEIGGFGLGGKSPLAYTDLFYVTTIFDKIQYEYIVHRGKLLPTIELMNSSETNKRNGTEVKIYFKDPEDDYSDDKYKFIEAAKRQLLYFENVILKPSYLFDTNYKIIEGNHFKFRPTDNYFKQLHLCIGRVAYPINWDILEIDPIEIPVALKFEINDLIVTPERESLRYVKVDGVETKEILLKKIELVKEELIKLYDKQPELCVDSLIEYIEVKKKIPTLNLHGYELCLDEIVPNKTTCSLLKGFIGDIGKDVFRAYDVTYDRFLRHRKGKRSVEAILTSDFLNKGKKELYRGTKMNGKINKYLLEYVTDDILLFKTTFLGWRHLYKVSGLYNNKDIEILPYNTNLIKQLKILKSAIDAEIIQSSTEYKSVEIPEHIQINEPRTVRQDGEYVVYNYMVEQVSKRKKYVKFDQLEGFTGLLIYGTNKNEFLLDQFSKLFKGTKYDDIRRLCLIRISTRDVDDIGSLKTAVHVKEFINDNKVFRHITTSLMIQKEDTSKEIIEKLEEQVQNNHNIFPHNYENLYKYRDIAKQYVGDIDQLDENFVNSLIKVAKEYNLYDKEIYDEFIEFNEYFKDIQLLKFVESNNDSLIYIIDYLKLKSKPILELWNRLEKWQEELIIDLIKRMKYVLDINNYNYLKETNYHYYSKKNQLKIKLQVLEQQTIIFTSLLNYHKLCQKQLN